MSRALKQLRRLLATRELGCDFGHEQIICLGCIDLPMGEFNRGKFKLGSSSGRRRSVGHLPWLIPAHLLPELVDFFGCQWLSEYICPVLVCGYPSNCHATSSDVLILADLHSVPIHMRQIDAVTARVSRDR